jgi:hypothetical protein
MLLTKFQLVARIDLKCTLVVLANPVVWLLLSHHYALPFCSSGLNFTGSVTRWWGLCGNIRSSINACEQAAIGTRSKLGRTRICTYYDIVQDTSLYSGYLHVQDPSILRTRYSGHLHIQDTYAAQDTMPWKPPYSGHLSMLRTPCSGHLYNYSGHRSMLRTPPKLFRTLLYAQDTRHLSILRTPPYSGHLSYSGHHRYTQNTFRTSILRTPYSGHLHIQDTSILHSQDIR